MAASIDPNVFLFAPARSRRASPRLSASGEVRVYIVALNHLPVELRNLSFGGFATGAARPFTLGTTYQFRFVTHDGVSIVLRAKVAHCYRVDEPDTPYFVTGWEFIRRASEDTDARIGQLVDSLAAGMPYGEAS